MSKMANPFSSVVDWFRPGSTGEVEGASPVAVEARPREDQLKPESGGGWFFRKRSQKQQNLQQLQRGYEDVVDLMETCKSHMESQAQRADRLLELLEDLPEALRVIPESSRQQAKMIEGLQSHLENQNQNTARLTDAVEGLATATQQHEKAMGVIQSQLDANQQNGERMVESFSALGDTLGRIGAAHQSGNDLLNTMAEKVQKSDDQMRDLFTRNQRQVTVMSLISWTLAISALLVAGYIGVKVSQMPIGQQAAAPAPAVGAAPAIIEAAASEPAAAPKSAEPAAASVAPVAPAIAIPQEVETPAVEASAGEAIEPAGVTVEEVFADELIKSETPKAEASAEAGDLTESQQQAAIQAGQYIGQFLTPQMQQWMQDEVNPLLDKIEAASGEVKYETASAAE